MRAGVDPDFAAYVAARQHQFLRAAFLVCGDRAVAEDLLREAFVRLARRWDTTRTEDPDGFVRTILYREAVSASRHRHSVLPGALDALTPRQRAVVVLRAFEDRPVDEAAEVLGVRVGTVRGQPDADPDLLARLSSGIEEVDLADTAWTLARQRGQRRRRVFALVAGAAAATVVVSQLPGRGTVPTPVPSRTSSAPSAPTAPSSTSSVASAPWTAAPRTLADGTTYVVGPTPAQLAGLIELRPGLPSVIGWTGSPRPMTGASQHVVAVLAQDIGGGGFLPVLLLQDDRTRTQSYAVIQAVVTPVAHQSVMGLPQVPVDLRAVSPDGTRVAIVQDTDVLVADVRAGTVNRFPLPNAAHQDDEPTGGGFTDAGRVVVTSEQRPLSMDPATGAVTSLLRDAAPDPVRLTERAGDLAIATTHPDGNAASSTTISLGLSSFWGQSSAGPSWVARGGFPPQDLDPSARPALNGLFVVARDRSRRVVLTIDDGMDTVKGAIRALGWVDEDVLFTYANHGRTWVLAFDPRSNRLYRVSEVLPTVAGVGEPGPLLAVWLGNPRI